MSKYFLIPALFYVCTASATVISPSNGITNTQATVFSTEKKMDENKLASTHDQLAAARKKQKKTACQRGRPCDKAV